MGMEEMMGRIGMMMMMMVVVVVVVGNGEAEGEGKVEEEGIWAMRGGVVVVEGEIGGCSDLDRGVRMGSAVLGGRWWRS